MLTNQKSTILNPEELAAVGRAFEAAWTVIADEFAGQPDNVVEEARSQLASIVLDVGRSGNLTLEEICNRAVESMQRSSSLTSSERAHGANRSFA